MSPDTHRRPRPGHGARRRAGAYKQGGQNFGYELVVTLMELLPAEYHDAVKKALLDQLNAPKWLGGGDPTEGLDTPETEETPVTKDTAPTPATPAPAPDEGPIRQQSEIPLEILYANWRGEISLRRMIPMKLRFGSTEWHPDRQWLLTAFDLDKDAYRDFALRDVLGSLEQCNQLQADWLRGIMRELRKSMRDTLILEMDPEDADHLLSTLEPALSALEAKHQPPSKKAPT